MRLPTWMAIGAMAWVIAGSSTAHAFCRSTTCKDDCARDENDCKIDGAPLEWKTSCVGFSFQRDGTVQLPLEQIRPVISAAFVEWTERDCGSGTSTMSFTELAEVTCSEVTYDLDGPNANVIVFRDNRWDYTTPDNTLAKTTVSYDPDSGEILDADIEVNTAGQGFTIDSMPIADCSAENDCYDLQSVLTHEIGHLIGLDHTPDFAATMNMGYTRTTQELRSLEPDDIAAVCAVYPPGREAVCRPEPNGGLIDTCEEDSGCDCRAGAAPTSAMRSLLLAGVALCWVVRRRRGHAGYGHQSQGA